VVQPVDETVDGAGNSIWMSVTKVPRRDDKGERIGLVSTTREHQGGQACGGALREKCTVGRGSGGGAPAPADRTFAAQERLFQDDDSAWQRIPL
jgi:hypothetical protein